MKKLKNILLWDLRLLIRYRILNIAIIVAIAYSIMFKGASAYLSDSLVIMLIFSDPAMLGFMFIGALVLFEKSAQTLSAITVTPLKVWQYLWSKIAALTILALPCSITMALTGLEGQIQWHWLLLGVILSSVLFTLLGFIGVLRVDTLNQYLIVIPLFLIPLCVPLLSWFNITREFCLYYAIPTQASLLLFKAANGGSVTNWQLLYALVYLFASIGVAYYHAHQTYLKYIRK